MSATDHKEDAYREAGILESGKVFHWSTALDNYEPTRRYGGGYGVAYVHPTTGIHGAKIWPDDIKGAQHCVYLFDNGANVTPYYVAGWNLKSAGCLFLHQFPTNYTGPDGLIDFGNWFHGPRAAYHLKVSEV